MASDRESKIAEINELENLIKCSCQKMRIISTGRKTADSLRRLTLLKNAITSAVKRIHILRAEVNDTSGTNARN